MGNFKVKRNFPFWKLWKIPGYLKNKSKIQKALDDSSSKLSKALDDLFIFGEFKL